MNKITQSLRNLTLHTIIQLENIIYNFLADKTIIRELNNKYRLLQFYELIQINQD